MPAVAVPEILQAEAYHRGDCILIRNERTERIIHHTRHSIPGELRPVGDFAGFLDATARLIDGAVILTLGDSITANVSSWAYALADRHLRDSSALVINLADWGRSSENHVVPLEFCLDWLAANRAGEVRVALMLGLRDIHDRIEIFNEFLNGERSEPLSDAEERLLGHRYARDLTRLAAQVPAEWEAAEPWIARRILAGVKIMERLCRDAGCGFFAILEPSAYPDCSPGYRHALNRAYRADTEAAAMPFEEWLERHRYVCDPSVFGSRDHRPVLDELRRLWRGQAEGSTEAHYLDWSALFRGETEPCFQSHFDAVHFNPFGAALIAEAVAECFAASRDGPGKVREAEAARQRVAIDRWMASVRRRLNDAELDPREIDHLFNAFIEHHPAHDFPAAIERRGLQLWLAQFPDRADLRQRFDQLAGRTA